MAEKIMQGIKQISELIGQAVKKRVVCLYRVSTVGQVEKDDIPMQKQYCREFCRGQSGWEIVKQYSEKGVSGFKVSAKDRDAIQEIQKMALKGEFDNKRDFLYPRIALWKCGKRPLHRWKTNIHGPMEKLSAFPQPANIVSHSSAPLTVYTHSHSTYYCY